VKKSIKDIQPFI